MSRRSNRRLREQLHHVRCVEHLVWPSREYPTVRALALQPSDEVAPQGGEHHGGRAKPIVEHIDGPLRHQPGDDQVGHAKGAPLVLREPVTTLREQPRTVQPRLLGSPRCLAQVGFADDNLRGPAGMRTESVAHCAHELT